MKCPHCGHRASFQQAVVVRLETTIVVDEDGDFVYFSGFNTHKAKVTDIAEKSPEFTCLECEQTFTLAQARES
jgi:DNA-directed RNA polymerase subunit RPC12/RpoP